MMGIQAEGSAAIVKKQVIKNPETIATAIRIGNPASWEKAEAARDESKGTIDMVSDEKILEAYNLLAAGCPAGYPGYPVQFRDPLCNLRKLQQPSELPERVPNIFSWSISSFYY